MVHMDGRLVALLSHAAAAVGGALAVAVLLRSYTRSAAPDSEADTNGTSRDMDCSSAAMQTVGRVGKAAQRPPCHSHFRVYAVVVYERPGGGLDYLTGTNCEFSPYIGGALCAERVALSKLCEVPHRRVVEVYIVTDNPEPLAPSSLCREFMSGFLSPDTPLHLLGGNNAQRTLSLAALFPYPSVYAKLDRDHVVAYAQELGARAEVPEVPEERAVYDAAISATSHDDKDAVYPMRYAAAVLFDDGTIEAGWQLKAMEYGSTLDAVTGLIHTMQAGTLRDPPRRPTLLAHADHCGVLHAPVAQARALLGEHGFQDLRCLLHDGRGRLCRVLIQDLTPEDLHIF